MRSVVTATTMKFVVFCSLVLVASPFWDVFGHPCNGSGGKDTKNTSFTVKTGSNVVSSSTSSKSLSLVKTFGSSGGSNIQIGKIGTVVLGNGVKMGSKWIRYKINQFGFNYKTSLSKDPFSASGTLGVSTARMLANLLLKTST